MSQLWTPESFRSNDPPERVIGFETEYDVRDKAGREVAYWEKQLLTAEVLETAGLAAWGPSPGYKWLTNGAYLYKEIGAHAEYATPECLGPEQAVLALHAGNAVVADLVTISGAPYQVFRRSATVDPRTGKIKGKGFHSNFCIPHDIADLQLLEPLESLWATQLFAWGGIVTKQGFNISPKALDIGGHITGATETRATEGKKPYGLLRAPGFNDDTDTNNPIHGFGRIEDRTKTPGNPWSDFMGAATTSLMLRILEHPELTTLNRRLRGLVFYNSIRTFRQISRDISMQETYRMRDGRQLSALDVEENMAQLAQALSKRVELPGDEVFAIDQWEMIIAKLRGVQKGDTDLRAVARHIGWVGKYLYLSNKLGEGAIRSGDPVALQCCLNWDRIAPKGAGQVFDERRGTGFGSEAEYKPLKTEAPEGTRAGVRADYIQQHVDGEVELASVRWPYAKLKTGEREGDLVIRFHPYERRTPTSSPPK